MDGLSCPCDGGCWGGDGVAVEAGKGQKPIRYQRQVDCFDGFVGLNQLEFIWSVGAAHIRVAATRIRVAAPISGTISYTLVSAVIDML